MNSDILSLILAEGDQLDPKVLFVVMRSGAVIRAAKEPRGYWYLADPNHSGTVYLSGDGGNAAVLEGGSLAGEWFGIGRVTGHAHLGPVAAGAAEFWRRVVEFNDQFRHKFKL